MDANLIPILSSAVPLLLAVEPQDYAAGGSSNVVAHILPQFMQHQQQTNWCWAAAGTSVGLFFQTGTWTQCDTANGCLKLSGTNCCTNPNPCNVYGYLDQSLTYTKSFASMAEGTEPTGVIESQLNFGRPVCARVAWKGGGAHFLAIAGYSYPDTNPNQVTITLQDSIYGTSTMLYTDFPARYHGGGTWTHSYLTMAQP